MHASSRQQTHEGGLSYRRPAARRRPQSCRIVRSARDGSGVPRARALLEPALEPITARAQLDACASSPIYKIMWCEEPPWRNPPHHLRINE